MIDLNEVEAAARKPWYCRSKLEDNLLSPEILVELITRLREAEKDAERINWLESNGFSIEMADYDHVSCNRAAIDKAMKEKGNE